MLKELLSSDVMPAMERMHRGQTVLHLAVKKGELSVVEYLVEKFDNLGEYIVVPFKMKHLRIGTGFYVVLFCELMRRE